MLGITSAHILCQKVYLVIPAVKFTLLAVGKTRYILARLLAICGAQPHPVGNWID